MNQVEEPGTRTVQVGFRVDGDWLADFARTRLEEGAWDRALKLLMDSVTGLSTDQAIDILMGVKTFSGDSSVGIKLKKTTKKSGTKERMASIVEQLWGRVFRHGEKYYKPYARVVGPWSIEDLTYSAKNDMSRLILGSAIKSEDMRSYQRSLSYADNPSKDMLVYFEKEVKGDEYGHWIILCKECSIPPFWMDVPVNQPEKFLRHLIDTIGLGFGRMEYRGAEFYEEPINPAVKAGVELSPPDEEEQSEEAARNVNALVTGFAKALDSAESPKGVYQIEKAFEDAIDLNRKQARGAVDEKTWDELEEVRKRAHQTILSMYRRKILDQAAQHGGLMRIALTEGDRKTPFNPPFAEIPKNAFIHWVLKGFDFEAHGKEVPVWTPVSPMGFKIPMDDPYHTDFLIGGGADPNEKYHAYMLNEEKIENIGMAIMQAAWQLRDKIAKEWTAGDFTVLSMTKDEYVGGKVVHAKPNEPVPPGCIAICANAGPDYQAALESVNAEGNKGALICEVGGKLAHLATVGREYDVLVLQANDALKKYREDMWLSIDMKSRKITFTV
jgi:hypothetical protein